LRGRKTTRGRSEEEEEEEEVEVVGGRRGGELKVGEAGEMG